MIQEPDPDPTSFKFHLMPGQAIAYPGSTYTPRKTAFLVQAAAEGITTAAVQEWFKQCIVPLVGEEAALILLEQVLGGTDRAKEADAFWSAVTTFRQSLVEGGGSSI
jgi:hypothetical protein